MDVGVWKYTPLPWGDLGLIPEPGITCGLNFSWFSLLGEFLPSSLSAKAKNSNSCATPGTKGQGTTLFMCHYLTVTQTTLQSRVRANIFLSLSSPLYNIMFAPCSAVSCSVLSLISPRQESRQSLPFPRIISFSVLLFYKPCMLSIWIYALNIFPYLSSILSLSSSFF